MRLTQNRYLCGDKPTIADLSAACELDSSCYIGLDLSNFPKTKAWLHHMIDENAIMNELSVPVRQVGATLVEKQKEDGTLPNLNLTPSMEYNYPPAKL